MITPAAPHATRRSLITGVAAVGAVSLVHRPARAAVDPFTLGVASGEPTANGFVIWTRLAPDPLNPDGSGGLTGDVPVTWAVATDEAMRHVVMRGEATAPDRFGRAAHVELSGLTPGRPLLVSLCGPRFSQPDRPRAHHGRQADEDRSLVLRSLGDRFLLRLPAYGRRRS